PTSTKPNPRAGQPRTARASLSNPAANPTGFTKVRPKRVWASRGSATWLRRAARAGSPGTAARARSPAMASPWLVSGSRRKRSRFQKPYPIPAPVDLPEPQLLQGLGHQGAPVEILELPWRGERSHPTADLLGESAEAPFEELKEHLPHSLDLTFY